jgi:hypothetical protein
MENLLTPNRPYAFKNTFYNGGFIGKDVAYTQENRYNTGRVPFSIVGTPIQTSTSATSIDFPTGLKNRDVLFLVLIVDDYLDYPDPPTTPSGWTYIDVGGAYNYLTNFYFAVFYKVVGYIPDTSISGLDSSGTDGCWVSYAIRGLNMNEIHYTDRVNSSGNVTNLTPPSIDLSSSTNPCLVVVLSGAEDDVGTVFTQSSGYTPIINSSIGVQNEGAAFNISYKVVSDASSESPGDVTINSLDGMTACTFAFNGYYDNSGVWKSTTSFLR